MQPVHRLYPRVVRAWVWIIELNPKTRELTRQDSPARIVYGSTRQDKIAAAQDELSLKPTQGFYLVSCYCRQAEAIYGILARNGGNFKEAYKTWLERKQKKRKLEYDAHRANSEMIF